jgi:beta-glucanase (GH16 family)
MKSFKVTKRIMAFALALVLTFSSVSFQSVTAYAAEVDESLTVPFGISCAYDADQGIGVVWGAAGYDLCTVTISSENGYSRTYEDQTMGYHWYPDTYAEGDYLVSVQGQKDGMLSKAGTEPVTVGEAVTDPDPVTPEEPETPETPENQELTTPFGQVISFTEEKGIGVAWGFDGVYENYTVTVECADVNYKKVYEHQSFGYKEYQDDYVTGTYTVSIQGEKDGQLSAAATGTVEVVGKAPEAPAVPVKWSYWTGEGGAADITPTEDGTGAVVAVTADGGVNYAVQYIGDGFKLVEGETYVFSGDFTADEDAKCEINIQETQGWGSLIGSSYVFDIAKGETKHVELTTNAATGAFLEKSKIAIMFGNAGNAGKTVTISNLKLEGAVAEEEPEEPVEEEGIFAGVPAINFDLIDHTVDYSNVSCDIDYDNETITVYADNYGMDWGADSLWEMQLKEVITVPSHQKYFGEVEINSEIARDIVLKLGDLNNDGATFCYETIHLEAGDNTVSFETTSDVNIDDLMVLFALGGSADANTLVFKNLKLVGADGTPVVLTKNINLEKAETELYVGNDWAGAAASKSENGEKVEINVGSFGWNGEWALQYMIYNIQPSEDNNYTVRAKITSTVDKKILIKLDNNGLIVETIELKANEPYYFEKSATGELSDAKLYFALGQMAGEEANRSGKITIENVSGFELVEEDEYEGPYLNLERTNTELYTNNDWSWSNATKKEKGPQATINVAAFGGGWGYDTEWGLQYKILNIEENPEGYHLEFDITSTVDKNVIVKLDNNGIILKTVSLKANETYHFDETTTTSALSDGILYFALGRDESEGSETPASGVVTIENIDGITAKQVSAHAGKEYDFTADNSEFDYADPGLSKDGYQLIWNDEFDGNYGNANVDGNTGLNLDNWAYQLGDGTTDCGNYGWGNNELQAYTDNKKNIAVNEDLNGDGEGEGVLRITASYEDDKYYYANESAKNYTSGRIRTTKPGTELFNTTYGYIEARISLPETQGAWPAFWMLPESTSIYGGWPVSGEIDILETTGTQTNKACSTLHWGTPSHVYKGSGYTELNSELMYFHTYSVDWEPGKMTFYYDGQPIHVATNWESGISGASDSLSFDAPFDQPFYMILNLAVDSGQFGGSANKANFKDEINMYVDYVRVFQKEDGYADSVERQASGANTDWADYAGQNQIAAMTADNLVGEGGGMDDANSDKSKWYLSTQSDAAATATAVTDENGKVWHKVDITNPGGLDYSVQLIGHFDVKPGYVYKVSFDSYAAGDLVNKNTDCSAKEWAGWSAYGITSAKLTEEPTRNSFTFLPTDAFDNCRIEFNFGARGTGSVYISDVKVEIVDPALLGTTEKGRTALADGNLIYNGDFSQGNNHLGYWTAKENTTVSVPRYTVEALKDSDKRVVDVASKTNYEAIENGVKYYERRAQISAKEGYAPTVSQPGIPMTADDYTVKFDLYSKTATAVKVSVLNADGQEVAAKTVSYNPESGVRTINVALNVAENLGLGTLQFTFAKGTEVQLDNVSMYGKNQALPFDENPVNDETTWNGDNGAGGTLELITEADGAKKLANITSGGSWYAPQIGSSNFTVVAGVKYKLTYKYKTDLATHKYIVQEAGGSWTVVQDVIAVDNAGRVADENGYFTYETEFTAPVTVENCHVNFGFGDSGATGNNYFVFKDVTLTVVKEAASGDTVTDEDEVDNDQFVDDVVVTEPDGDNEGDDENNNNNNGNTNTGSNNSGNNNSGNSGNANTGNSPAADTTETPAAGNTTAPATVRPGRADTAVTPAVVDEAEEAEAVEEVIVDEEEAPLTDEIATDETVEAVEEAVIEDEEVALADKQSTGFAGIAIAIITACAVLAAGIYAFLKTRKHV